MESAKAGKLDRDLKILARFIRVYCGDYHKSAPKATLQLKTHDLPALLGKPVLLCPQCRKLLAHALVKRTNCPMDPKPACKHCPNHCYHPEYRARIREVMKYSGRKMVMSGRLDYLIHLFF